MPSRTIRRRGTVAALAALGTAALGLTAPAADAAGVTVSTGGTAPLLTVTTDTGQLAPGLVFTAPKTEGESQPGLPNGPLISDNLGRPVWFSQLPNDVSATDFQVQRYQGKPVLTYWAGNSLAGFAHGDGTDYILNQHYQTIATVKAGNGLDADQHEFRLTDHGTALITSYDETTVDASSVGGPTDQDVLAGVVQEIDIKTGKVVWQWNSLDHVPLSDSYVPLPSSASTPWDYFHINAVRYDTDGNLLINARHTWALYKVNRKSGNVIWELGGKESTFDLGPGVEFAWQHDPEPEGHNNYRIFDNESNGTVTPRPATRIIVVHLDPKTDQATLVSSLTHPDGLLAPSQGNAQALPDGHLFVGWGQLGRVSEFSKSGELLWDASVPQGQDDYRAFRDAWVGKPLTQPTLTATTSNGNTSLDVVWNGATQVAQWRLLSGNSPQSLGTWATVPWDGLDTHVEGPGSGAFVQAEALDAGGKVIGTSDVVPTS